MSAWSEGAEALANLSDSVVRDDLAIYAIDQRVDALWPGMLVASAQQAVTSAGRWIGQAVPAVDELLAIRAFQEGISGIVSAIAFEFLQMGIDILVDVVKDIIQPIISLFESIPIIGWVIELFSNLVFGIIDLARAAKAEKQAEKDREPRFPNAVYNARIDALLAEDVYRVMRTSDWTELFLPAENPYATPGYIEPGFACSLLKNGWRSISSRGELTGFGGRPGGALLRQWEVKANPGVVKDAGEDLFPLTNQALAHAWSMTGAAQPHLYAVDTWKVESAWRSYFELLYKRLAAGDDCSMLSHTQRHQILAAIDIPGQVNQIIGECRALRSRQIAGAKLPLVAYVADDTPMKALVAAGKRLQFEHNLCNLNPEFIVDGLLRSNVEDAQRSCRMPVVRSAVIVGDLGERMPAFAGAVGARASARTRKARGPNVRRAI